jgi:hypothetical protein
MRTQSALLACSAVLSALGCSNLEQDLFASAGGISPDPTAIVSGTILYVGPRPSCVYGDSDVPLRVAGNVILTMFEYGNPPPPEGSATAAANLLALSGDELFDIADCVPKSAQPNYSERITRSASFRWPRIPLGEKVSEYQIRGFYDYDEDMLPFFSTTRVPTAGDVVGAALNDLQDPSKGLFKLTLPPFDEAKNGVARDGLTVSLGSVVWTERPAFRLSSERRLAADAPFSPVFAPVNGTPLPSAAASLRSFRRLTCAPGATAESCGLALQRFGPADEAKLEAGAVTLELNGQPYAFFSEPVDLKTVSLGSVDAPVPDGVVDPHPFLGGLGVPWLTPMVVMQRLVRDPVAAAAERDARIPRVLMVGSVLLDDMKRPVKGSFHDAPIAVAPIAAVELIPGQPQCRVPYFPPGTAPQLRANRVARCAELPTGLYGVNVFGGIAGGQLQAAAGFPGSSDSPMSVRGGRYSGQLWSVPNELANPTQQGGEANVMPDQGFDGTFVVHDPSPLRGECPAQDSFALCQENLLFSESELDGLDVQTCLPRDCCLAVAHLCGRPLCDMVDTPEGRIAKSPPPPRPTAASRVPVPDCVPFEIPSQCCPLP